MTIQSSESGSATLWRRVGGGNGETDTQSLRVSHLGTVKRKEKKRTTATQALLNHKLTLDIVIIVIVVSVGVFARCLIEVLTVSIPGATVRVIAVLVVDLTAERAGEAAVGVTLQSGGGTGEDDERSFIERERPEKLSGREGGTFGVFSGEEEGKNV